MAAGDRGEPSHGARRRTPDHPPYCLMIRTAIQALAEEGGSTESSISQYIKSNYNDLPWGHDRLLPYYLNKLTAQGEFVVAAPARYLVAQQKEEPNLPAKSFCSEDVVEPLQTLSSSLSQPEPKETLDGEEGLTLPQSQPAVCDGDVVEEFQTLATLSRRKVRKNQSSECGLEAENHGEEVVEPLQTLPPIGQPEPTETQHEGEKQLPLTLATLFGPKPITKNDGGDGSESVPVPKRCGRPPKRKCKSMERSKVATYQDGEDVSSLLPSEPLGPKGNFVETKNSGDGSKPVPKRRGRPPKSNPSSAGNSEVGSEMGDMVRDSSSKEINRDEQKPVETPVEKTANEISSSVPKRRGRPPKRKPDDGEAELPLTQPTPTACESDAGEEFRTSPTLSGPKPTANVSEPENHEDDAERLEPLQTLPPLSPTKPSETHDGEEELPQTMGFLCGRKPTTNMDIGGDGSVPKRRGRPPKRKQKSMETSKRAKGRDGDSEPMQLMDPKSDSGDASPFVWSESMGPKVGVAPKSKRVSKRKFNLAKTSIGDMGRDGDPGPMQLVDPKSGGRDDLSLVPSKPVDNLVEPKNDGGGSKMVPRRRGRPPKSKPSLSGSLDVGLEMRHMAQESSGKETGRDEPKPAATQVDKTSNESSSLVPKRRGRPPKHKPNVVDY